MKLTEIEQLYRDHRQTLVRWLSRMVRCEEAAADLAQDAYVKFAHLPTSQLITSPRAYLFKTARNLAVDHFRKERFRGHRQTPLEDAGELPTLVPSPEVQTYHKERMTIIGRALATLPVLDQAAFVLCRIYGHSYKEIAERLGISERAIEHRLVKAMTRCQEALLDEE